MPVECIDLRSDTVTCPTDAMRAAMAAAEVGDDVYGEDPTVNALQDRLAGELGFDAASFIPTAQKLAEIQKLDVAGRSVLLREAWSAAHDGQEPPRGPGYRNWLVDLALEAAYRLRQPETP